MNTNIRQNKIKKPNKKWADYEIKMLLDFMQEHQEIEKPTAQIFYRKFVKESGIDASWDLCRWKVKHLKNCYLKTRSLEHSAGANLLESHEGKLKSCRFYRELHNIFGPRYSELKICDTPIKKELELNITSVGNEQNEFIGNDQNEFIANDQNEFIGFEGVDDFRCTPVMGSRAVATNDDCIEMQSSSSASLPSTSPSRSAYLPSNYQQKSKAVRLKKAEPKSTNSLDELYFMQRNTFLKLKIDFEKEKFQKEFELKERQFEEEIKERKENLELKKLEIEKAERLRILEIEKQERVERFEIEMRYKHGSQK